MSDKNKIAEAKKLLLEKKELILKIKETVTVQGGYIDSGDTENLLICIEQRQNLIDNVDKIDTRLHELAPLERDAELLEIASQTKDILIEISGKDKENEALANRRMDELKEMMKNVAGAKKQVKGYYQTPGPSPVYFDKQK